MDEIQENWFGPFLYQQQGKDWETINSEPSGIDR